MSCSTSDLRRCSGNSIADQRYGRCCSDTYAWLPLPCASTPPVVARKSELPYIALKASTRLATVYHCEWLSPLQHNS
jgi:hypothetical protein